MYLKSFYITFAGVRHNLAEDSYAMFNLIFIKNQASPQGYKSFFHTQLSMKFIMLINVEMPTIVGFSTFNSIIKTTSESSKARKVFIFSAY